MANDSILLDHRRLLIIKHLHQPQGFYSQYVNELLSRFPTSTTLPSKKVINGTSFYPNNFFVEPPLVPTLK